MQEAKASAMGLGSYLATPLGRPISRILAPRGSLSVQSPFQHASYKVEAAYTSCTLIHQAQL